MPKGYHLEFKCCKCDGTVAFSVFDLDQDDKQICCSSCGQDYAFKDPVLKRQICKFYALCRQIRDSEEILSSTSVAIDIGQHHVKFPYKLLLTRLNSQLDLQIGNQHLALRFRMEPINDLPEAWLESTEGAIST